MNRVSGVERRAAECPDRDRHYSGADEPSGYIGWHEWAKQKNKTHRQTKCKGCGLYLLWLPRRASQDPTTPQTGGES